MMGDFTQRLPTLRYGKKIILRESILFVLLVGQIAKTTIMYEMNFPKKFDGPKHLI